MKLWKKMDKLFTARLPMEINETIPSFNIIYIGPSELWGGCIRGENNPKPKDKYVKSQVFYIKSKSISFIILMLNYKFLNVVTLTINIVLSIKIIIVYNFQ